MSDRYTLSVFYQHYWHWRVSPRPIIEWLYYVLVYDRSQRKIFCMFRYDSTECMELNSSLIQKAKKWFWNTPEQTVWKLNCRLVMDADNENILEDIQKMHGFFIIIVVWNRNDPRCSFKAVQQKNGSRTRTVMSYFSGRQKQKKKSVLNICTFIIWKK